MLTPSQHSFDYILHSQPQLHLPSICFNGFAANQWADLLVLHQENQRNTVLFSSCIRARIAIQISLSMRRALSIALVLALCTTIVSPAWAASCCQQTMAKMCHRAQQKHHCGMMAHEHSADSDGISAIQQVQKCPMTCCMQATSGTAAQARSSHNSVPLIIAQTFNLFESQVFTVNGFSSHTDRGPPLVTSLA